MKKKESLPSADFINEKEKVKFSVLMSVYYKEKPEYLDMSLSSVFNQTLMPNEVVLVEDGKLTDELEKIIIKYEKEYKKILKVVRFKKNRGLGVALHDGLLECSNEIVFRMDSDDICVKDRFEKQISYMLKHPEIDALGSSIYEFKNEINEKNLRLKIMPIGNEIDLYIKKRNPLNHMTVCFKKSSVEKVGGYIHLLYLEDYYLWIRMYANHMKIENLSDPLVYARIGNGFEKRRGNKKQIIGWKKLQNYMYDNKIIDKKRKKQNIINMYLLIYTPNFVRKITYKFLRR